MAGALLLDVNVLVALLWPSHVHYAQSQAWFTGRREGGWATCPITQLGAVRTLSTPAVTGGELNLKAAAETLAVILTDEFHEFWPADLALSNPLITTSLRYLQGPRQLTDRYLLALAAAHDGKLVTFDRSVAAGLPSDSPLLAHLEIID